MKNRSAAPERISAVEAQNSSLFLPTANFKYVLEALPTYSNAALNRAASTRIDKDF